MAWADRVSVGRVELEKRPATIGVRVYYELQKGQALLTYDEAGQLHTELGRLLEGGPTEPKVRRRVRPRRKS